MESAAGSYFSLSFLCSVNWRRFLINSNQNEALMLNPFNCSKKTECKKKCLGGQTDSRAMESCFSFIVALWKDWLTAPKQRWPRCREKRRTEATDWRMVSFVRQKEKRQKKEWWDLYDGNLSLCCRGVSDSINDPDKETSFLSLPFSGSTKMLKGPTTRFLQVSCRNMTKVQSSPSFYLKLSAANRGDVTLHKDPKAAHLANIVWLTQACFRWKHPLLCSFLIYDNQFCKAGSIESRLKNEDVKCL